MTILHRYLFRELFVATFVGVALFAFVMLTGNAIKDLVGRVADGVLTVGQAAEWLVRLTPFVLTYALPMGLLTAVLLTLGRLSAQHEITAMRAAGVGLVRIAAPAMLLAVVGVALSVVINFTYAPDAKSEFRRMLHEIGRKNPVNLLAERRFTRDFPDWVVYVSKRDGDRLLGLFAWHLNDKMQVTKYLRAESATARLSDTGDELILELRNSGGDIRRESAPEDFSRVPTFAPFGAVTTIKLPVDEAFRRQAFVKKPSWMNFQELVSERRRLATSQTPGDRERLVDVEMNIHEKAALGFSVLSLAMVGIPLGVRTGRKETSANLGLALVLTMAYYFMMIAAGWMDKNPGLHPELLLWLPNIGFQALGVWLWWRLGKN